MTWRTGGGCAGGIDPPGPVTANCAACVRICRPPALTAKPGMVKRPGWFGMTV